MHMTVMIHRKMEDIGVLPPVLALTLLLPYPPNAGRAMKSPPQTFATPRATNSRFALRFMFLSTEASPVPKLFAATLLSKNPSSAITKAVLKASDAYWRCISVLNGKCMAKGFPCVLMSPRILTPL